MKKRSKPRSSAAETGQRLGIAAVMFHDAVASRMGLGMVEVKAWSALRSSDAPMTSGQLAGRLGLTTGAVTGLVERLVSAGLVRRKVDTLDGRKVLLEAARNPRREREHARLTKGLRTRIRAAYEGLSEVEQALVAEFLSNVALVMEEEAARLRATR